MAENAKIRHFLGKNRVVVPIPTMQWASGTGTSQFGTGTTASNNLNLPYFCTVKSRIRTRLFRDPKKRLMGVQIKIELSEKRTVPRRVHLLADLMS